MRSVEISCAVELWRSAAAAFPNATVYTLVIHISDLLPVAQQQNLKQINTYITPQLSAALIELKKNTEIIIKPADKGSSVVILDRQ